MFYLIFCYLNLFIKYLFYRIIVKEDFCVCPSHGITVELGNFFVCVYREKDEWHDEFLPWDCIFKWDWISFCLLLLQIASRELKIPLSYIHLCETSTTVPSGKYTAGSIGAEINARAVQVRLITIFPHNWWFWWILSVPLRIHHFVLVLSSLQFFYLKISLASLFYMYSLNQCKLQNTV